MKPRLFIERDGGTRTHRDAEIQASAIMRSLVGEATFEDSEMLGAAARSDEPIGWVVEFMVPDPFESLPDPPIGING